MPIPRLASQAVSYFSLDHLIAPFLIKAIYWVGIVAIFSAGLGSLFSSSDTTPIGAPLTIVAMLLTLLLWRLFSELLILAFNIHSRLTEIRDLLHHRQTRVEANRRHASSPSINNPRLNPFSKVQHD